MVRHILLIRFKNTATLEDIHAVRIGFLCLSEHIDGILDVEWGENDSPENINAGFTHCVLMTFSDDASRRQYLPHPAHDKLKERYRPVVHDIIVFDYMLDRTIPGIMIFT